MDIFIKTVGGLYLSWSVISIFLVFIFYFKFLDERNKKLYLLGELKPYKKTKRVISSNEAKLFESLKSCASLENYYIFPQIPYSAILSVDQNYRDLKGSFEEINKLRADFVVTEKVSFVPVLAIELNDSTHFLDNRKARDKFVQSALDSSGLQYLVLETKDISQKEKMNALISSKLKIGESPQI